MKKYIGPLLIVVMAFLIVGSCNGDGGNSTTTRTIGPGGGTITSADGKLTLDIPEGALDQDTEITVKRLNQSDLSEQFSQETIDCAYELTPEGLTFNFPVIASVRLNEDPNQEDGSVTSGLAFLFTESGEVIEFLENPEIAIDAEDSKITVSAELTHFTELVTVTVNGITATLNMVKQEDIPDTFTGTVTVSSSTAIEGIAGFIAVNQTGATLSGPSGFGNLPISSAGGMSTGTINAQCVEEKGFESYIVQLTVEQVDLGIIFTFDFIRPEFDAGPIDQGDDDLGFSGVSIPIESILACIGPGGVPTLPPPPPPPPPEPSPEPPALGAADIQGNWDFNCEVIQEAFPLIVPNLGDPFMFNADLIFNPETSRIMINPIPEIFMLEGPLVPQENGDFQFSGSGSGFLTENPAPNDANIQIEAQNWTFSLGQPSGFTGEPLPGDIVAEGELRFNFPTLPLDSQSSRARCDGIWITEFDGGN